MTGPRDGSRIAIVVFFANLVQGIRKTMVSVDFPSPAGVGLMAVTKINLPTGLLSTARILSKLSLALSVQLQIVVRNTKFSTTSTIGFNSILCAIQYLFSFKIPLTSYMIIHYTQNKIF